MSYSGRGYSRGGGGFRGRRGGGGGGGSWRGGRNNFDSSENRFNTNYEQRSRGYFRGRNERFSERGREKRSFRQDNREYSDFGRSSPEPMSKRLRRDSSPYSGGMSRRSHDRSFGEDFPSRSFYNNDKRSGGEGLREEEGLMGEDEDSRVSNYQYRKARGGRFNRGRGRSFSRISVRNRAYNRSTPGVFQRRRNENFIRKKSFTTRSQERLERLYTKLKRRLREEDEKRDEDDGSDWENEIGDFVSDEEEEKEETGNEDEIKTKEDEDEEEEDVDEREEEMKEDDKDGEKEEREKDESPKKGKPKEKESKSPKKTDTEEVKSSDETKGEEDDEEEEEKGASSGISKHRLKCIHCGYSSIVFKEYKNHIKMKKHQMAMKGVFMKLRETLARMRVEQRRKQRMLDEENKINSKLRSVFCNICKLNYRMYKSDHIQSVSHKRMEEFLYPLCRTCLVSFKTPMRYEEHICDLEHIKRKIKTRKGSGTEDENEDDSKESPDLDSNFLVLDSVGSGDETEGEKSEPNEAETKDSEVKTETDEAKKKKKKSEFRFGTEYCKLVEAYYCELCRFHLPDKGEKLKTLTMHCRSRGHLRKWMRESRLMERRAILKAKAAKEAKKPAVSAKKVTKAKTTAKAKTDEKEEGANDLVKIEQGEQNLTEHVPMEEETKLESETKEKQGPQVGGGERVESGDPGQEEKKDEVWSEVDKDLTEMLDDGAEPTEGEGDGQGKKTELLEDDKGAKGKLVSQPNGEVKQIETV